MSKKAVKALVAKTLDIVWKTVKAKHPNMPEVSNWKNLYIDETYYGGIYLFAVEKQWHYFSANGQIRRRAESEEKAKEQLVQLAKFFHRHKGKKNPDELLYTPLLLEKTLKPKNKRMVPCNRDGSVIAELQSDSDHKERLVQNEARAARMTSAPVQKDDHGKRKGTITSAVYALFDSKGVDKVTLAECIAVARSIKPTSMYDNTHLAYHRNKYLKAKVQNKVISDKVEAAVKKPVRIHRKK